MTEDREAAVRRPQNALAVPAELAVFDTAIYTETSYFAV